MSSTDDRSDSACHILWDDSSTMEGTSRRSSYPGSVKGNFRNGGINKQEFDSNSRRTSASGSEHRSYYQKRLQNCRCRCSHTLQRLQTHPLYPSWPTVSRILALSVLGLMLWGNAFSIVGLEAGPQGQLFKIGMLCVAAHFAGWIVHFTGLPPLLGMLIMGILLRNVGFTVLTGKYLAVAANLRKMALVVILIRAGVGLDPVALKRLSWMVLRLSVVPSVVEAISVAVTAYFLLDLPCLWGLLLGAVLAAVSPAVVIPCLFNLQDKGYGKKKGIPTLVVAAASIDDINAISAFGVLIGIIFSQGSQTAQIVQGPVGLLVGLLFGSCVGLFLRFVPQKYDTRVVELRSLLLATGGMLLMFGIDTLGYKGAGPLGCIVAAFVANHGWRSQGWSECQNPVADNFVILWTIFQPILFGLLGTEIDLFVLEGRTVGFGVLCLFVSLALRMLSSALAVAGGDINFKEKLFVALAWFPKATVQAAIGPVALGYVQKNSIEEVYAGKVLMVAVLAIIITAPIGAIFITVLGPKLLHREKLELPKVVHVGKENDNSAAVEALITSGT